MWTISWSVLRIAVLVVWLAATLAAAGHAIMYKRNPRSAAIWVLLVLVLPVIGPCFYFAFGINRVERHAIKRRGKRPSVFLDTSDLTDHIAAPGSHGDVVGHLASLRAIADRVTRLPLLEGNRLVPLHNGEQAYPRMLAAIHEAERTVTLASYIFDWDDVGHQFADALEQAARRGVRVHALIDGIGALGNASRMGRRLLRAGVELSSFFPLRFPFGRFRLNLRNHRKLLVVDGRLGFTGGMNISQRHMITSNHARPCHDLHFELSGPVVAELQHTFVDDWAMVTHRVLQGPGYFPDLDATGPALCRGIPSGPDADFEIIHSIVLAAFHAAQRSVRIATPYFVPGSSLVAAMVMAALRGVKVTLLLPSKLDLPFMRWVADAYLWQLLVRGIEVYRHPPPFVHTKLMVVDDRWVLLGSANLDPRSFRLNFEFNVEAYDPELARSLVGWYDETIRRSDQVSLAEVDSRPLPQRLRDGLVKMFSPHL